MGMTKRRLTGLLAAAGAVAVGALGFASPAAAQSFEGGLCELNGTANFHGDGLTVGFNDFAYDFGGTLTNCQSNAEGAPADGAVSAGQPISGPNADLDATTTYATPSPTGNGGCQSSTTSGTSFVEWSDGTLTIVEYETTGVLAAVELTGTVRESITLTETDGNGEHTFTTTRFAGGSSLGQLVFETQTPQDCATGLKSATIQGVVGVGNSDQF